MLCSATKGAPKARRPLQLVIALSVSLGPLVWVPSSSQSAERAPLGQDGPSRGRDARRYVPHDGLWWYWQRAEYWLYRRDGRWFRYDRDPP